MNGSSRGRHQMLRKAARNAAPAAAPAGRNLRFRRGLQGREETITRSRLAWLNTASANIGTTLDLERTAGELAEFTVPSLADGVAVDLLEAVLRGDEAGLGQGEGAAFGAAEPPPTRAVAVRSIDSLSSLEPSPVGEIIDRSEIRRTLLMSECIVARRPVLVSRMKEEDYDRVTPTDSAGEQMRRAGVHSYMALPLIARGRLLGTADFIRAGGSPPFSSTDLAVAEQLVSKAAVFIDNARLYGRERQHVLSLQRSMLPRAKPVTPGLNVRTDYAPALDARGVGGDWYDVVALPSGRTALMVGDVTGHGLPAAATMGRLRAVARTLMTLDIAPDRLLARLDLATRDLEDEQVATCLCAVFDPADGSYTLASAGHPPPLVLDGQGKATFVDVPVGAPLGAGIIPYDSTRIGRHKGGKLVLYTDGLIKTRVDDIDVQLGRLRDRVAAAEGGELDAGRLLAAATDGQDRFDEAVLLVAAEEPDPEVALRVWDLPADGNPASAARKLVSGQLRNWELDEFADVTELVVSELVGNALRYGNGPGQLRLLRGERLMVEVSDTGPDLPQIQHADLSDEGGRGLQLINMLCRSWGSCRTSAGKVVWAEQDIAGVA